MISAAPYYILWAFITLVLLLISTGLLWMVFKEQVERIAQRAWFSDLIWYWLFFTASYHTLVVYLPGQEVALRLPPILWFLWGALAIAMIARLALPFPGTPTVLFGLLLVLWAGLIGAGDIYISDLEKDLERLRKDNLQVFDRALVSDGVWQRAWLVSRMSEEQKELLVRVSATVLNQQDQDPTLSGLVKSTLIPQLTVDIERDLKKLKTWQILEVLFLLALLLGWGFGKMPNRD